MLTLSFPRGFGLLVFVLPTYRRPKPNAKRQPLLAVPPIDRDLLADAQRLAADGHLIAAAMTCRVELERLVTLLALKHPEFGLHWRGLQETTTWLRKRRVLKARTAVGIHNANDVGNKAAHGKPVTAEKVNEMIDAAAALRHVVRAKAGAA